MSEKKLNVKEIVRKVIFAISLIVFIGSGYKLFSIWKEYNDNSKVYKELELFEPKPSVEIEEDEEVDEYVPTFNPEDYDKLLEMNSDFRGWVQISNTNVNYPIVQAEDNEFYLTRNFKKEKNSGGAIFLSYDNDKPFEERNTIVHGHNMKDGSMFASLMKFKEEDFFNENKKIFIVLRDKVLEYEIFSAYVEQASHNPYQIGFASDEDYVAYLNGLRTRSLFHRDQPDFTKDDKIITLSTCSYEIDDGRMLLHARLIEK